MPSIGQFLDGYNFNIGEITYGYKLSERLGEHITIIRYQKYKYQLELTYIPVKGKRQDVNKLLYYLKSLMSEIKEIKAIRNYYTCYIDDIEYEDNEDGSIIIFIDAHSIH